MKLREYWSEIVLSILAVVICVYTFACIIVSVGHIFFSDINEPTPFLATWRAIFIALAALIAFIITAIVRLAVVGRETVEAYHQSSDEEKVFLRRLAIAIFRRVKQTDGKWGQRAKVAEDLYEEVK